MALYTYVYVSSLLLSSEIICGTRPYEWGTQSNAAKNFVTYQISKTNIQQNRPVYTL